jgi:SAM-dependent methyltransferase
MAERGTTASSRWHSFLRRRDLAQIVESNPGVISGPLLEIGAGSGVVTEQLRELATDVIPTDVQPRAEIEGFVFADVQKLPFEDSQFRFIYSSNVLEHVADLPAAMGELKRVLMDDGVMIHSMPTVSWKITQLLVHPLGALKSVYLNRGSSAEHQSSAGNSDSQQPPLLPKKSFLRRIFGLILAPIHGVGSGHIDEMRRFSKRRWEREFSSAGFEIESSESLYFHSPYRLLPFRLMWLRNAISKIGCASVRYYRVSIVKPADLSSTPEVRSKR